MVFTIWRARARSSTPVRWLPIGLIYAPASRLSLSKTVWMKMIGMAGKPLPMRWAIKCSWLAMIYSSPIRPAWQMALRRASPTQFWSRSIKSAHCRKRWKPLRWRIRPAIPLSCRTARAKRKTQRLPTSLSRPIAARLKPARWRAQTAWRNITSLSVSKKYLAIMRFIRVRIF